MKRWHSRQVVWPLSLGTLATPWRVVGWAVVSLWLLLGSGMADQPEPLAQAHSHNDYHQPRPLLDALDHGFCNVEADVFLVEGELLVGHDPTELRAGRTLQKLYLEPLRKRVQQHQGRVYPNGPECVLLIDIKSAARETFAAVHVVLAQYAEMITHHVGGVRQARAVQVVISGNRDFAGIAAADPRWAGVDGRIADVTSTQGAEIMPMISDNWGNLFTWRGEGPIPDQERQQLIAWVKQAHQAGRRIRFWNTPERELLWQELAQAQVDLINTDDLPRLQRFLHARQP